MYGSHFGEFFNILATWNSSLEMFSISSIAPSIKRLIVCMIMHIIKDDLPI